MAAHITSDDDGVTRLSQRARRMDAVHGIANARRRDEQVVHLSLAGHLRIAGDDAYTRFSSRLGHSRSVFLDLGQGKAPSMTKAHDRYKGWAPIQDKSFTVPQMLSLPILPPGNSGGDTMKPSVVKASLSPSIFNTAASSPVNSGFEKWALNT